MTETIMFAKLNTECISGKTGRWLCSEAEGLGRPQALIISYLTENLSRDRGPTKCISSGVQVSGMGTQKSGAWDAPSWFQGVLSSALAGERVLTREKKSQSLQWSRAWERSNS